MTSNYSHGGHGWNLKLWADVSLLETAYSCLNLCYNLPYRTDALEIAKARKSVNPSEDQGKSWWSQRDLNPCLSLERAPS